MTMRRTEKETPRGGGARRILGSAKGPKPKRDLRRPEAIFAVMVLAAIAVLTAVSVSEDVSGGYNVYVSVSGTDIYINGEKAGEHTFISDNRNKATITFKGNLRMIASATEVQDKWGYEFVSYDDSSGESTWTMWSTSGAKITISELKEKDTTSAPSVSGSMSKTASGGYYGRINTAADMEYRKSGSETWNSCTGETAVYPGTYEVRYKLTGEHYASDPTTVGVGPEKPVNTQDTPEVVEYTGAKQEFVPSGLDLNWVKVGGQKEAKDPNTGDAYYTVTVDPIGCWSDGSSTDSVNYYWKIVKKNLTTADFTFTGNSIPYDGDAHGSDDITIVASGLTGFPSEDITELENSLSLVFENTGEKVDCGTYKFTLSGVDTTKFTTADSSGNLDGDWEMTITKRAPEAKDFVVTVDKKEYNGTGQTATVTLIEKFQNQPDNADDWLSWTVGGATTQTNVQDGGYAIEVKVDGTKSQNFETGNVPLNSTDNSPYLFYITKRTLSDGDFTISYGTGDTDPKFDTKEHKPTITLNPTYNTVTSDDCSWLTCKIGGKDSQINAGDYNITVYVVSNTNFETNTSGITINSTDWSHVGERIFTIDKHELKARDFSVTYAAGETYTYEFKNGQKVSHTPIVEFKNTDFVNYYSDTNAGWNSTEKSRGWLTWQVGDSDWTDNDKHSQADAGTYTIKAAIGENTNFTTNASLDIETMTINKRTLTASDFTVTAETYTYDGDGRKATSVSLKSGDTLNSSDPFNGFTPNYFKDGATTGSEGPVFDAGTYQIKLCCDGTDNYNAVDEVTDGAWILKINQAKLKVESETLSYGTNDSPKTYDATDNYVGVTVSAYKGNTVTISYTWDYDNSSEDGTGGVNGNDVANLNKNVATLELTARHVSQSGKITWTASAGNNYEDYVSTANSKDLTVKITSYQLTTQDANESSPHITVKEYVGDYDGEFHAFEVGFTLFSADTGNKSGIKITYGTGSGSVDGEISSIHKKYFTDGAVTAYYKLSYGTGEEYADYADFAKYGDYSFEEAQPSTIEVKKLQMAAKVTLDSDIIRDSEEGMSATTEYSGGDHVFSASATNLKPEGADADEAVVVYTLNGTAISADELAAALGSVGTYEIGVKVSAETGKDYSESYTPFERTVTVEVTNASVRITEFSYETVTEGEPMTMTVKMESVGTLSGAVTVTYRGQPLTTTCIIVDNSDGTYTATVVYDTSLGDIPSGTLQTISVEYPGDSNHSASGLTDYIIRMRSTGMPVIPEEGGQVPIDPDKNGIEVETPAGDIRFDLIDPPELGDGDTIIIDVTMRYASAEELVPDEESTIVLNTYGYVLHSNGDKTPIKYRVTPSVDVEVPSGKKPVVTLYDEYGSEVGTPDVLTYTSDSATFQTDADGSLSMRIGVSFKSKAVPTDEPVVPVYPEETGNTEEGRDYTLIIVVACVAITLEILAVIFSRRSRN